MSRLTPDQRRDATRLQRAGLTLREIAGRIGASYEAVCLWLYGEVADWTPPEAPAEARPGPVSFGRKVAVVGHGDRAGLVSILSIVKRITEIVDADAAQAPQAKASTGNGATEPDGQPADSVSGEASRPDPGRSGSATSERMDATGGESAATDLPDGASAVPMFRLRNELGEYLHRSGSGMGAIEKAWSGTAEQLAEARRRKPHLMQLDIEEVAP